MIFSAPGNRGAGSGGRRGGRGEGREKEKERPPKLRLDAAQPPSFLRTADHRARRRPSGAGRRMGEGERGEGGKEKKKGGLASAFKKRRSTAPSTSSSEYRSQWAAGPGEERVREKKKKKKKRGPFVTKPIKPRRPTPPFYYPRALG